MRAVIFFAVALTIVFSLAFTFSADIALERYYKSKERCEVSVCKESHIDQLSDQYDFYQDAAEITYFALFFEALFIFIVYALPFSWYFFLERVTEFSQAIKK